MKCPLHPEIELVERWKKDDPNHLGQSFFSHKQGDGWCNGKPPKPSSNAVQSQALDVILNKLIKIETRLDGLASFLKRSNLVVADEIKPHNGNVPF